MKWIMCMWLLKGAFHLVTQVSFCLYSFDTKKDRIIFVSICIIKWKAPINVFCLKELKQQNYQLQSALQIVM